MIRTTTTDTLRTLTESTTSSRSGLVRHERVRAADEDDRGPDEVVGVAARRDGVRRRELRSGVEGRPLRDPGRRLAASSGRGRSTSGSRRSSGSACRSSASPSTGTRSPGGGRRTPTSPSDRAYDWRRPDRVLRGLRRYGLTPVLTLLGTPAWANGGRGPNFAPPQAEPFRRVLARCCQALPVGSLLADLERAEQAALAEADAGGDLRPAPAQPRVQGDPRRPAARAGGRRRDGAARRARGRRTRQSGSTAWPLHTRSSTPTPTTRIRCGRTRRRPAAAARTAPRSRWRRSRSSSSSSGATSGRSRSG